MEATPTWQRRSGYPAPRPGIVAENVRGLDHPGDVAVATMPDLLDQRLAPQQKEQGAYAKDQRAQIRRLLPVRDRTT